MSQSVREIRARQRWGCSYEEYLSLRCKPMRTFQAHRSNARHRGIGWELTLWQWWAIWQESGHWEHRGRGQGYVMCRYRDVGPYSIDNVFIGTCIENSSNKSNKISNLPIGVSAKRVGFLAERMMGGIRYDLGIYDNPESAHEAYLSLGPIGVSA